MAVRPLQTSQHRLLHGVRHGRLADPYPKGVCMNTEQERAELLPCPFCGAGKTEIRENRPWLGTKWGEPVSVSVRHWCDHVDGQPSRMIERVGRDRAAAVAAWNMRT